MILQYLENLIKIHQNLYLKNTLANKQLITLARPFENQCSKSPELYTPIALQILNPNLLAKSIHNASNTHQNKIQTFYFILVLKQISF